MDAPIRVWLMVPGDRPHYAAQWIDPDSGKRRTRSLKTSDEDEAEKKRRWIEDRLAQGLPLDEERLGWAEFRARFLSQHVAHLRPHTRRKMAQVLDCLERHCAPATPRAVDAACLRRLVAGMRAARVRGQGGYSAHTIQSYLGDIRTALRWARECGHVRIVPDLPAVKVPRLRPRPVPAADYERLLAAMPDGQWRAFLALAWSAGLRLDEARQLRREEGDGRRPWLDLAGMRIWLPAAFVKGCEDSWVPLAAPLALALAALPRREDGQVFFLARRDGRERSAAAVSTLVGKLARRAGLRLNMQKLRRGFACRLAARVPAHVLQRLLRHKDSRTAGMYYVGLEDASLRDAIDGL